MKRVLWGCTVGAGIALTSLAGASGASAQTVGAASTPAASAITTCSVPLGQDGTNPVILPSTLPGTAPNSWTPTLASASAAAPATGTGTGALAFTGADVAGVAATGAGMVVGGLLLLRATQLHRKRED